MNLSGKRILVVEDDSDLAGVVSTVLRGHGAIVIGPAPTPFYALQLLGRRDVDWALLDVQLYGSNVFGLADELAERGTPMIFATGAEDDDVPEHHRHRQRLSKPYDPDQMLAAFAKLQIEQDADMQDDEEPAERPVSGPSVDRQGDGRTRLIKVICTIMRQNAERRDRSDP